MRIAALGLLTILVANSANIDTAGAGNVVAGTYTCPNITIDSKGQIVAISNGSCFGSGLIGIRRFAIHGTYTYTPDPGTKAILLKLVGAGASGNGCMIPPAGGANIGQSGGGGAYLEKFLATNFTGKQIAVGQGGAPSESGNSPGNNGGDTTFDAAGGNYKAGGGIAGNGVNSAAYGWQVVGQASGGTAINGDYNEAGQIGGPNTSLGELPTSSSVGANSRYGQGGVAEVVGGNASLPGASGIGNGSGGSGGICLSSGADEQGGAGTDGYAEFDEYR
jgi:hypothetical protein